MIRYIKAMFEKLVFSFDLKDGVLPTRTNEAPFIRDHFLWTFGIANI